ncbi:MAG: sulfotransferase domain-containing protein [Gemmatimonadota bacterium]
MTRAWPRRFLRWGRRGKNQLIEFQALRRCDAFIISPPKAGRTWLRVLLWKYLSDTYGVEDRDLDLMRFTSQLPGAPVMAMSHDGSSLREARTAAQLDDDKRRYQRAKVVFLARDPRDLLVSLYYQATHRRGHFAGDISAFLRDPRFGVDKMIRFMNIWEANRTAPREFLLVRYEDMRADPARELERMLLFLGVPVDAERVREAVAFADFPNMRRLEREGYFASTMMRAKDATDEASFKTRKGQVGGYREELSPEDVAYLEERVARDLAPAFGYTG